MSRERFFMYSFVAAFCWYFFPGYIFTALSTFNWVCWIVPNNVVVNQLFGVSQGLGMGIMTFDWSQINYIGASPLVTPLFAQANTIFGLVVFFWICAPILYYTNNNYAKYLPMSTTHVYDRFAKRYNVSRVITDAGTLNDTAYNAYSRQYLSSVFSMSYGLSFASMTATLTHTVLYSGKDILRQFKRGLHDEPDIHARLMSVYREVPAWWYAAIFVVSVAMGIGAIEGWPTLLPVWALFLALAIGAVYTIPIAVIFAVSNVEVSSALWFGRDTEVLTLTNGWVSSQSYGFLCLPCSQVGLNVITGKHWTAAVAVAARRTRHWQLTSLSNATMTLLHISHRIYNRLRSARQTSGYGALQDVGCAYADDRFSPIRDM